MHPLVQGETSLPMNRRIRRMMKSPKAVRAVPLLRDRGLTDRAFARLVSNLEGFGNRLTEKHREALYCVVGRFTMLANGAVSGRFAYDLPCGGGKTQAIVAWCAACHELGLPYSVAVCASKVEALCDLKRDLMANGVPEEKIGLIHSYGPKGASLPPTEGNEERQFLLVTHARVRSPQALAQFNTYRGRARSFVIYDESLFISEHRAIGRLELESALGWWGPRAKSSPEPLKVEALEYLTAAWDQLEGELRAQREGRSPQIVRLPAVDPDKLEGFIRAVGSGVTEPLVALLRMSQEPLRVALANLDGGGVIKYEIVLPPEIGRMAILDASWPIRELERMDRTIESDPCFDGNVKSYGRVTVHQLRHGSGRSTIEQSFSEARREARKISLEVCEVVRGIPEDEGVLLFTHKHRSKVHVRAILEADLRANGINTDATLPDGQPRFAWLTWGQETSLSQYAYCGNVLLVGVLHRSDADLSGAILGQRNELLGNLAYSEILSVRRSEAAHAIYQALSRGSCRMTEEGEARAMNVWMIHPEKEIKALLERVMPGVVWREWDPKHLASSKGVIEATAERIAAHLSSLPADVVRVSTRSLKKTLDLSALAARTFTYAVEKTAELTVFAWQLQGRSFVRVN